MISLNPSRLNRCDFYIIIWVLYYLQGILYPSGGILSLALLSINTFIGIKYWIKVVQIPNIPKYLKGLNVLVLLFTVYGFAHILFNPLTIVYKGGITTTNYLYIKQIYLSLLPIYPFYYFTKEGYLTGDRLRLWGIIFLVSIVLTYFRMQQEALAILAENGYNTEEITNNAGYLFLSYLPLLVLYQKRPFLQFTLLAFVMAFIVMGMKRGAIIIGVVATAYFMFQLIRKSHGNRKFALTVLSTLLCIGAIYFFIHMMNTSEYMMKRIQDTLDGNTSARDEIYTELWHYFTDEASVLYFFFGAGADATLKLFGSYAHNDWLELAVNQGIFGLLIYVAYFIRFYKTSRKSINKNAQIILYLSLMILFVKAMISMSYGDMTYISTCVIGYALGISNNSNEELM